MVSKEDSKMENIKYDYSVIISTEWRVGGPFNKTSQDILYNKCAECV
jgi:hypothetical protein